MTAYTLHRRHASVRTATLGTLLLLLVTFLPLRLQPTTAQQNCRGMNGFQVCDRFLDAWNKQGSEQASVYVNGFPITERRPELSFSDGKVYETQWFERARFEYHPENQQPNDVLLGRLGATLAEGRTGDDPVDKAFAKIDQPLDVDGQTKVWFSDTHHTISGKILEYWTKYGGIPQFGFPLSEPFDEVSPTDKKMYTVQYFERNRLELHPENVAPYEVELGLLGVQQHDQQEKLQPALNDELPNNPPAGVQSSKDTLTLAMHIEPPKLSSLGITPNAYGDYTANGTSFTAATNALMIAGAIEDKLVEQNDEEGFYAEDAYYLPTLENGGSYYVGSGGDKHMVTKFRIRPGIKWSDGTELTSDDAVAAFDTIRSLRTNTSFDLRLWLRVQSVVPANKYTVIYNWMSYNQAVVKYNDPATDKQQYAFLNYFISTQQPVVAPDYLLVGDIRPHQAAKEILTTHNPLGTGPFKVESWTGGQLTLVQNPYYSLTGKPLLKQIIFRFFPNVASYQNDTAQELRNGTIDGAIGDAFDRPPTQYGALGATSQVDYNPSRAFEHLDFNFNYGTFQSLAVRQAVITAINRPQIANSTGMGSTVVLNTVLSPVIWSSLQNTSFAAQWAGQYQLPIYNYDPAKAALILANDGWVRDDDGILMKNGQRLSLIYGTTPSVGRQQVANQVKSDLKAIGIEVDVQSYPGGQYYGGILGSNALQLNQFAWFMSDDPDFSVWRTNTPQNYAHYSNSTVDTLIDQLANATNRNQVAQLSAQIQTTLMQDVAIIPLFPRVEPEVHPSGLVGWKLSYEPTRRFTNVTQWYFR